jgi:hypothetical protein
MDGQQLVKYAELRRASPLPPERYLCRPAGRGKHGVARIEITAIRYCARAGDISEEDAIAEGFKSAAQFREVYARINGAGGTWRGE